MFESSESGSCRCHSSNPIQVLERIAAGLFPPSSRSGRDAGRGFDLDVRDVGDALLLEADLPGMRKEDLRVELLEDQLTISAQREGQPSQEEAQAGQDTYLRRERPAGKVSRTFDISGLDTEAISARYRAGVLTLRLPKLIPEVQGARRVEVQ